MGPDGDDAEPSGAAPLVGPDASTCPPPYGHAIWSVPRTAKHVKPEALPLTKLVSRDDEAGGPERVTLVIEDISTRRGTGACWYSGPVMVQLGAKFAVLRGEEGVSWD